MRLEQQQLVLQVVVSQELQVQQQLGQKVQALQRHQQ
jgi:hypothetical protein